MFTYKTLISVTIAHLFLQESTMLQFSDKGQWQSEQELQFTVFQSLNVIGRVRTLC